MNVLTVFVKHGHKSAKIIECYILFLGKDNHAFSNNLSLYNNLNASWDIRFLRHKYRNKWIFIIQIGTSFDNKTT